ncbi:hypothetical protein B0T26DRAFT_715702 [Lasiosphaeria miniovina]|uniref:Uncharacterized protein n=1 Tax=Lasiosphaeria miniovina TaxID=1954250 RepID=A0AA40DTM8_9PEZI|nr:uncharacterized protein B0T26DRAFT_715702 [Lasiosphaeria miniovina]KAK0712927.1 hypothetical protein B0T26DRAFT_715702 [Lasiosphaeria miniovina]
MTWFSTVFISEAYASSSTIQYGSTPVTPVPTSTAPIVIVTSYIDEPIANRNINQTTWETVLVTVPLTTQPAVLVTTTLQPPTVTLNSTTTETVYTSAIAATVTFAQTTCSDGATASPTSTTTVYTGGYAPVQGQVTTVRTRFPTALTTYASVTASYRVYTYVGSTVTFTSTVTGTAYLSTTTAGTQTVGVGVGGGGRYNTRTKYLSTVIKTRGDYLLAYATRTVGAACGGTVATAARAAQCAPTNLIAERDGRGVAVRLLPDDWTFPIGFPGVVIGIPGMDASACCQLCLDNKHCAASEWTVSWSGACRLYYYNSPGADTNGSCGAVPIEYYGDIYALPGQGSYVQSGCGSLKYLGRKNPFCELCDVGQPELEVVDREI